MRNTPLVLQPARYDRKLHVDDKHIRGWFAEKPRDSPWSLPGKSVTKPYRERMIESESAMYWRRRAVAIAGVAAVVLLLIWAFSGPSQPGATAPVGLARDTASPAQPTLDPPVPTAGEPVAQPLSPTPRPAPAAPLAQAVAPPSAAAESSGQPASSAAVQPPGPARLPSLSASAPGTSSSVEPSTSSGSGALDHQSRSALPSSKAGKAVAPAPSALAQPVQQPAQHGKLGQPPSRPIAVASCPDRAVKVFTQIGASDYQVGERPRFQLLITNVSHTACSRDLNPWLQELVVSGANGARLWSSNDCSREKRSDVRTLEPGKPAVFAVDWAGRTSRPGCVGKREPVGPGMYQVVGRLGALTSLPAPFILLK